MLFSSRLHVYTLCIRFVQLLSTLSVEIKDNSQEYIACKVFTRITVKVEFSDNISAWSNLKMTHLEYIPIIRKLNSSTLNLQKRRQLINQFTLSTLCDDMAINLQGKDNEASEGIYGSLGFIKQRHNTAGCSVPNVNTQNVNKTLLPREYLAKC